MSILQDLRYGLRMLVKAPAFTVLAVLTLALGVCANTTIFSFINGALLRPLTGVRDPGRLVAVYTSDYSSGLHGYSSYLDYVDFRDQTTVFENLAASSPVVLSAAGEAETERLRGFVVTGNYFAVLGVNPQLGRTLQPADDRETSAHAIVISDALWRRRFNANPAVIGQTLTLNSKPHTIVGVAEPSFRGLRLGPAPEFWQSMSAVSNYSGSGRGDRGLKITGRLKPGVTIEQVQTQLTTIAARLAQAYPETNRGTIDRPNDPRPVTVAAESLVEPPGQAAVWRVSVLLFAVVGLVLLIACANVANLLLARASVRRREIAVRLALGASRGRLVRQLLTEGLLLALLGGACGLLLTQWTVNLLPRFFTPNETSGLELGIDWRVLVFTLAMTILTAMLFGLVPALQATRQNLLPSLKEETSSGGQRLRRFGLRNALVVSQLALSLVLLVGAALFVRSLQNALTFDPGFAAQQLLTASMEMRGANMNAQTAGLFYEQMTESARTLPGVQSVTLASIVPLSGGGYRRNVYIDDYQPQPNEDMELNTNNIGLNFFSTMGIQLLAGRDFTADDKEGAPLVVIVNEEMARRYFGGNAVGKRLRLGSDSTSREIIGVARNAKYRNLREQPLPFIYVPLVQENQDRVTLMVRSAGDPSLLIGPLRNELSALNKSIPVFSVQTMSEGIDSQIGADRMIAVLLSVFGGGALVLAAIGIYGVMGYTVVQRTHEIGIRIALGAEQRDILRMIIGQGLFLIAIGAGVGLVLALAATRVLDSLLFGVSATDPLVFSVVLLLLVGVALLACYLPARRATKVDPLIALRSE